jgi:hypothetical protein
VETGSFLTTGALAVRLADSTKCFTTAFPEMLMKYVGLANVNIFSDMYLFRPLYRSKNKCGLMKVNKPISYTTARECIVKRFLILYTFIYRK